MKYKKYIFIFLAIFTCIIIYIFNGRNSKNLQKEYDKLIIDNVVNTNEETNEKDNKYIKIHISGEINYPGLLELPVESRIYDAIERAGGQTENADISKINLAYILSDGEKIYIPSFNDENFEEIYEDINSLKVNINLASEEKLQELPGIGKSTAEAIIEYRKNNGKFENIEDIKNVSGIGESKFNKIKDYICIK